MQVIFRFLRLTVLVCILCLLPRVQVGAGTVSDSPYVEMAPDGRAWTTCPGETHNYYYDKGYFIDTGMESTLRSLQTGEHYYKYNRTGEIPVGKWMVEHANSQCIHDNYPEESDYHGISYGTRDCGADYTQGWLAYCADCEQEVAYMLMYMCEDAAESITGIPIGTDYYYLCPHCNNLEQGATIPSHICERISWNRYVVDYKVNTDNLYNGFEPEDTYHMYNNATVYEGNAVTPNTKLAKMNVTVVGYEFVGWNTMPDGNGTWYQDEQEIYNLTAFDSAYDSRGVITLYAQWKLSESTLLIDPAGGSYLGNSGITSYTKHANDSQDLYPNAIVAPGGPTLRFQTNGGNAVPAITVPQHFERWASSEPFGGRLVDNTYWFHGKDGTVDRLTAVYAPDEVILPDAKKENASFGGWYYDADCKKPAGGPGDMITIREDTTLYAQWVELTLDSVANYTANNRKGAVDLSWTQPDLYQKAYRVYKSLTPSDWTLINATMEEGVTLSVNQSLNYSGSVKTYTVPYTGLYALAAAGAQGGNYGVYTGGLGGEVKGSFWLNAGDTITYIIGGQNGYNGGGIASTYGNGGGATVVTSAEQGVLLVGAGGGGATAASKGGNGGETLSGNLLSTGYVGESGMAGGGGGYKGGKAGAYIYHAHSAEACGYHVHQGDTVSGGTCYTRRSKIGTCTPERGGLADVESWTCGSCGIGTYTEEHWYATGDCGGAISGEREHDYYYGECDYCGAENEEEPDEHTYVYAVYEFSCTKVAGYQCGKTDAVPEASEPAFGGSSYINTALCSTYSYHHGSNDGNGYFIIQSENVGFVGDLQMHAVPTPDLDAPDAVSETTIVLTPIGDSGGRKVTVSWERPEDNGTDYYFVVESHRATTGERLSASNIRMHTLTTGVKGYYCVLNMVPVYRISMDNGTYQTGSQMQVMLKNETQYLHIAPVDVAGNLGKTTTVPVGNLSGDGEMPDRVIPWPVYTEQMEIVQGEGVCAAEADDTYYVRCDNVTPIELSFRAYVEGVATEKYQITHTFFRTGMGDALSAEHVIGTPMYPVSDEAITTYSAELSITTEGYSLLKPYLYTATTRTNRNKDLLVVSQFLLGEEAEGERIRVTPGGAVKTTECTVYSDENADAAHSIYLVGDATAPMVQGTDILQQELVLEQQEDAVVLQLSAVDELSGLKDFYVKIYNEDNGGSKTYEGDEEGNISFTLTGESSLFAGEFTLTLVATDKVGNVRQDIFHVTGLGLETKVERILAPHEPVFKRGESGMLTIETWGHVERVVVEFPEHLENYNQVFEYIRTKYIADEKIQFMIPLYGMGNGGYEIKVWAYKGTEQLVGVEQLVVSQTILDELRTRLR